jgi:aminoglycoside phosphotransferase (APT) family kinase protein
MDSPSPVERLFTRLGLGPVHTVQPLTGGQLNTVLRVNQTHVLRTRGATVATGSLKREAAVLRHLNARVPAPEVVAVGNDDLLGEYLVETWLPGRSLLQAWLDTPDVATREWWMIQWTAAIRAIHEERFEQPGELPLGELKGYPSWRGYIEARVRKRVDALMRLHAVDRELVLAAERYLKRRAPVLEDGPNCLIHRDLHFGNVLVDGPHLSAVLDFELTEVGPPDYELDTIYRFLRYPWLFTDAAMARHALPSRFASVWIRLKRGYPELFTVRHLRERLSLYALDHCLSCLLQAHQGRWGNEAAVEATLKRLGEVLEDRYGPS